MLDARLREVREQLFVHIPRTEVILYYNSKNGKRTRRVHAKHDKERCRRFCRLAKNDRRGMSMKVEAAGADIDPAVIGRILERLAAQRGLVFASSGWNRFGSADKPYKFFIRVPVHDRFMS